MSFHRGFTLALSLLVILTIASVVAAAPAKPAAPANSIFVHDQETKNGIATVDRVTAAQDGWVVVYKQANLAPDMIVGYAPVKAGANSGVRVTLDNARLKDVNTLWVRLHEDKSAKGVFEWGLEKRGFADTPVMENNKPVIAAFATHGSGADLNVAPAINIKSQDVSKNSVVFDAVTTPVDGWVVLFKDPSLKNSGIVGYAPVYHGQNLNVKAAVEGWKLDKTPTLWAALFEDKGTQKLFEVGLHGLTKADPLYLYKGQPVVAPFGTTAQ
jgi:hypothetical protein